jgi:hypothetical protein
MSDYPFEKGVTNIKKVGVIAVIIAFLISLFFIFLSRFSFICLDPELCDRADKPLITNQP